MPNLVATPLETPCLINPWILYALIVRLQPRIQSFLIDGIGHFMSAGKKRGILDP